jgi:hypothetical protein
LYELKNNARFPKDWLEDGTAALNVVKRENPVSKLEKLEMYA